ncbi:succinylglutamate desuccinylase/aspartoacylase domain-containing protein [Natrononativus amylolyticus]|uniref:succinylglutamate desuccinylase/aspartoacylase domain-containing protein n=1 Tax=Natrononativus amylolyticus TaxID=2963434 RepID=UPI0020CC06A7|nr:succinylglutamate desuccinylase/aspartoacylase family protein [Natrononativus amylolyticus]
MVSSERRVGRRTFAAVLASSIAAAAGCTDSAGEHDDPGDGSGNEDPADDSSEASDAADENDADGDAADDGDDAEGSSSEQTVSTHTFGEGQDETTTYVIESAVDGPTALVIGGIHGDEPAGFEAAANATGWEIDAGTLVVIPEAYPSAVEAGTREYDGIDINKQFPVGEEPTTPHARALWVEIESHEPDALLDLHSSMGIYNSDITDGRGVGQAIFPTVTGDAEAHSQAVVDAMNEHHVPDDLSEDHRFEQGNPLGRSGQILVRKVAGDLEVSGYLVETTKYRTDLEQRVEWTETMVRKLLERHGLLEA